MIIKGGNFMPKEELRQETEEKGNQETIDQIIEVLDKDTPGKEIEEVEKFDFTCRICGGKNFDPITRFSLHSVIGGPAEVLGYECTKCSVTFTDPRKFSSTFTDPGK